MLSDNLIGIESAETEFSKKYRRGRFSAPHPTSQTDNRICAAPHSVHA
jgi:hypothetical protein